MAHKTRLTHELILRSCSRVLTLATSKGDPNLAHGCVMPLEYHSKTFRARCIFRWDGIHSNCQAEEVSYDSTCPFDRAESPGPIKLV